MSSWHPYILAKQRSKKSPALSKKRKLMLKMGNVPQQHQAAVPSRRHWGLPAPETCLAAGTQTVSARARQRGRTHPTYNRLHKGSLEVRDEVCVSPAWEIHTQIPSTCTTHKASITGRQLLTFTVVFTWHLGCNCILLNVKWIQSLLFYETL